MKKCAATYKIWIDILSSAAPKLLYLFFGLGLILGLFFALQVVIVDNLDTGDVRDVETGKRQRQTSGFDVEDVDLVSDGARDALPVVENPGVSHNA